MTRLAIHENSREMSENPNWKKKQSVGLLEYKLKAIVSVNIMRSKAASLHYNFVRVDQPFLRQAQSSWK